MEKVCLVAGLFCKADWAIGGRSKDETMQVKDQEYTHGNKALQVSPLSCLSPFLMSRRIRCSPASLCMSVEDKGFIRNTPATMGMLALFFRITTAVLGLGSTTTGCIA